MYLSITTASLSGAGSLCKFFKSFPGLGQRLFLSLLFLKNNQLKILNIPNIPKYFGVENSVSPQKLLKDFEEGSDRLVLWKDSFWQQWMMGRAESQEKEATYPQSQAREEQIWDSGNRENGIQACNWRARKEHSGRWTRDSEMESHHRLLTNAYQLYGLQRRLVQDHWGEVVRLEDIAIKSFTFPFLQGTTALLPGSQEYPLLPLITVSAEMSFAQDTP